MKLEKDPVFRALLLLMGFAMVVAVLADAASHRSPAQAASASTKLTVVPAASSSYVPQTRSFIVTTVPLLVHEQTGLFDYLGQDFGKKGMLADKEVWGFSPSTLTVYEGDTVHVTVVNPSGDDHTFTLPSIGFDLFVKAQTSASASFVVPKRGPFAFVCTIAEHSPYMSGELVVLPDSDAPQS